MRLQTAGPVATPRPTILSKRRPPALEQLTWQTQLDDGVGRRAGHQEGGSPGGGHRGDEVGVTLLVREGRPALVAAAAAHGGVGRVRARHGAAAREPLAAELVQPGVARGRVASQGFLLHGRGDGGEAPEGGGARRGGHLQQAPVPVSEGGAAMLLGPLLLELVDEHGQRQFALGLERRAEPRQLLLDLLHRDRRGAVPHASAATLTRPSGAAPWPCGSSLPQGPAALGLGLGCGRGRMSRGLRCGRSDGHPESKAQRASTNPPPQALPSHLRGPSRSLRWLPNGFPPRLELSCRWTALPGTNVACDGAA